MSLAELDAWTYQPDLERFPYEAVVREFQSAGKHFVSPDLLESLAGVRALLPRLNGPWVNVHTLSCFLDTALDKPDGHYDYRSYLALSLLELPGVDDPIEQTPFTRSRCDRLIVQLATDALRFELDAAAGQTTLLPGARPGPEIQAKRYRLALRAIRPALARLSLDSRITGTESAQVARQACAVVRCDMSVSEHRTLLLTMLPVYTLHDEYLFLRVLQMFETTFSMLAIHLRMAVAKMADRDVAYTVYFLDTAEEALRQAAPLFSMLATMQVDSFRTFRDFTEGASAIQSRNYKIVESLCREPDADRIESAAFQSVPDVRERVLAGQATLDDAFLEACGSGELTSKEREELTAAMQKFASIMRRWRTTHHQLATRMLGDSRGSGYTEGVPYLAACRSIPVFQSVGLRESDEMVTA